MVGALRVNPSGAQSAAEDVPEKWSEFFDHLEVMVFSGPRGQARSADDDELCRVAQICIEQSHARLLNDASPGLQISGS